jgi:hypothetical protein
MASPIMAAAGWRHRSRPERENVFPGKTGDDALVGLIQRAQLMANLTIRSIKASS